MLNVAQMRDAIAKKYPRMRGRVFHMPNKQVIAIYMRILNDSKKPLEHKKEEVECPECFYSFIVPDGGHRECPMCGSKT